jgi:GntR family transcriptional regulator, galactonate operon transcriptional repressor
MNEQRRTGSGLRLTLPLDADPSLPTGATRVAVETLGRRIAADVYAEGDVMPTELELAASLGVSRTTARDAIKVLSGKGLVRTARRYGTRVRPVEEWNLLDADVASWHEPMHPRVRMMFAETTELRCILEPEAAALAAERATDRQRAIIRDAAHAMRPEEDDVQALFDADCRFHATMLDATGNRMMRQLRRIILAMLRISYEYGVLAVDGEEITREGHVRVADAITARDPATARRAMTEMLERNRLTARRNSTEGARET